MVKGVVNNKYQGITLYQTDDDWPEVRQKIMRARSVWGMLETLLKWEGAVPKVSAIFYRTVTQEVLLFGSETWIIFVAMDRKVEGTLTCFI